MALDRAVLAAREHAEAMFEPLGELGRGQQSDAGRGELDRERYAVQPFADLRHRAGVAASSAKSPRTDSARATNRRTASHRAIASASCIRRARRVTATAKIRSPGTPSPSRLVARILTSLHASTISLMRRVDRPQQVLTVVEHEHEMLRSQESDEGLRRVPTLAGIDTEHLEHGIGYGLTLAHPFELAEPRAVPVAAVRHAPTLRARGASCRHRPLR